MLSMNCQLWAIAQRELDVDSGTRTMDAVLQKKIGAGIVENNIILNRSRLGQFVVKFEFVIDKKNFVIKIELFCK